MVERHRLRNPGHQSLAPSAPRSAPASPSLRPGSPQPIASELTLSSLALGSSTSEPVERVEEPSRASLLLLLLAVDRGGTLLLLVGAGVVEGRGGLVSGVLEEVHGEV